MLLTFHLDRSDYYLQKSLEATIAKLQSQISQTETLLAEAIEKLK
jgi:hypothetical protein